MTPIYRTDEPVGRRFSRHLRKWHWHGERLAADINRMGAAALAVWVLVLFFLPTVWRSVAGIERAKDQELSQLLSSASLPIRASAMPGEWQGIVQGWPGTSMLDARASVLMDVAKQCKVAIVKAEYSSSPLSAIDAMKQLVSIDATASYDPWRCFVARSLNELQEVGIESFELSRARPEEDRLRVRMLWVFHSRTGERRK